MIFTFVDSAKRLLARAFWLVCLLGVSWAQPLEVTPAPGEQVQEDRPCVQVSWPEGAVVATKCHLWFNGKEVTGDCLRSGRFLSFRPFKPPPTGPIEVRFASEDLTGGAVEKSWTFQFAPLSWIKDLQHNGKDELFEGDTLDVSFRARPKGKASFQVARLPVVPMVEKEPGVYTGSFNVETNDHAMAAPVTVKYQWGDHREEATIVQPVTIFGGFYRVKVLSPPDGSTVEQSFKLTGRARVGSRVSVIAKVGFSANDPAPTTTSNMVSGTAGSIPAEVDEQGNFQVEYGLPILLPGMHVVMTIFAVDHDGTRSVPTVVHYRFK